MSMRPFALTVCLFGSGLVHQGCAPKGQQTNTTIDSRIQAAQFKKLEDRITAMEQKTERLDEISAGVQLLLERLDALGSEQPTKPKKARPDTNAVYSVPIDGDPFIGPRHAKITIVEGYDFYCGFCDKVRPTLAQLKKFYGNDVKIVYKNFVIHDDLARLPALAACAAHKQGKFEPVFNQLWIEGIRKRQELTKSVIFSVADKFKLNRKRFEKDMYGECQRKVASDFKYLSAVGASGTPAFYINGRFLAGALPFDTFRSLIDEELVKVNAALKSGTKLSDYYQSIVDSGRKSL